MLASCQTHDNALAVLLPISEILVMSEVLLTR